MPVYLYLDAEIWWFEMVLRRFRKCDSKMSKKAIKLPRMMTEEWVKSQVMRWVAIAFSFIWSYLRHFCRSDSHPGVVLTAHTAEANKALVVQFKNCAAVTRYSKVSVTLEIQKFVYPHLAPKNWHFWTVVLEKTLESLLDSKIKLVNPKGNQYWIFTGRIDAEATMLWPPDAKSQLIVKDPSAGKDWRQKEKRATENELVGWHHWLNGHEFEQTLGDSEGQGSLACCSLWAHFISLSHFCPLPIGGENVITCISLWSNDSFPIPQKLKNWH